MIPARKQFQPGTITEVLPEFVAAAACVSSHHLIFVVAWQFSDLATTDSILFFLDKIPEPNLPSSLAREFVYTKYTMVVLQRVSLTFDSMKKHHSHETGRGDHRRGSLESQQRRVRPTKGHLV